MVHDYELIFLSRLRKSDEHGLLKALTSAREHALLDSQAHECLALRIPLLDGAESVSRVKLEEGEEANGTPRGSIRSASEHSKHAI
jgi:hypothetical protein